MTYALLSLLLAADPAGAPPTQALEIAHATMPRATWDGFRDQAAPSLGAQLEKEAVANGLALKRPGREVVVQLWDRALPYEEFASFYAATLAKGLTEAELGEVAAFHRSAAGRRFSALQRQLEADAQGWIKARLPRLGAMLNDRKADLVEPVQPPAPQR
jgi:hypothetical protein